MSSFSSSTSSKKRPSSSSSIKRSVSSASQSNSYCNDVKKISNNNNNKNDKSGDDVNLIQAFCDATKKNDATRIASLLGYRNLFSPCLDEILLSGSAVAARIEQHVFARLQREHQEEITKEATATTSANNNNHNKNKNDMTILLLLIRGLLMAPSAYDTPWKTALELVKYMQKSSLSSTAATSVDNNTGVDDDNNALQLLLPYLQCFLQQQITSWWWEKRSTSTTITSATTSTGTTPRHGSSSNSSSSGGGVSNLKSPIKIRPLEGETLSEQTPRDWILQLVTLIMEPLYFQTTATTTEAAAKDVLSGGETSRRRQGLCMVLPLLKVLSTVVSVLDGIKHMDSGFALLLDSILNTIFPRQQQQRQMTTTTTTTMTTIRMDCLLPWINLATDIALYLRPEDWSYIHANVMHHLVQQTTIIMNLKNPKHFPRLTLALLNLYCPTITLEISNGRNLSSTTTTEEAGAARNASSSSPPTSHAFEIMTTLLTVAGAAAVSAKPMMNDETTNHDSCLTSAVHQEICSSSRCSISIARSNYNTLEKIMENRLVLLSDAFILLLFWLGKRQDKTQSAASGIATDATPTAPSMTTEPPWICANMFLLILRAWQESQQYSNPMSSMARGCSGADGNHDDDGSNEKKRDIDPRGEIWQRLLLLLPFQVGTTAPTIMNGKSSSRRLLVQIPKREAVTIKGLQEILTAITYTGMGRFQTREGETIVSFTEMGRLVCQSLFLSSVINDDAMKEDQLLAKERAKAWIDVAMHILVAWLLSKDRVKTAAALPHDEYAALPLIVMITVYCEMPCSRALLVKDILRTLDATICSTAAAQTVTTIHILVVSVILRSTYGDAAHCRILNQLSDVFKMNLAPSLFLGLSNALLHLQSTPTALFASATNRLTSTFSFQQRRTVGDYQRQDSRDLSDSVRCGLLSLCLLVGMPSADTNAPHGKVQAAAWKFLSGIMIQDSPPLPKAAHSWLFHHIYRLFLERDISDTWTIRRLLRACLIRLLRCFGTQGLSSGGLFACSGNCGPQEDHGPHVVDIYSVTILSFSLLEHDLRSGNSNGSDKNNAMALFRSELFKVLSDWRQAEQFHLPGAATALRLVVPSIGNEAGAIVHTATFYVLAILFQFMLGAPVAVECSGIPSSSIELSKILRNLDDDIIGNSIDMAPTVVEPSRQIPCTQPMDTGWQNDLRLQLCEHFFFFLTHDVSGSKRCLPEVLKRDALSLSALSALEQGLVEESTSDGVLGAGDTDPDALYTTFRGFCEIVVPALKNLILNRGTLGEVDEIISAVLSMCGSVERSLETSSMPDGLLCSQRLLDALLSVYDLLCTENSVILFIDYMEKQCFGIEDEAKEGSSLADIPIESLDDLDGAVRNMRLIVLRATQGCLQAILREPFGCEANTLDDKSNVISTTEQCSCFSRIIGMFCRDLQVGLDGESGSISAEMYLAFVKCIEFASEALSPQCSTDSNSKQILATCIKSAEYLEGIICTFSLDNAGNFKKTMALLCYTLPSVVWAFVRHTLVKNDEFDPHHLRKIHSYSARTFEQCLVILRRRAHIEVTHTTPWEDLVDPDHLVSSKNQQDDASRSIRRRMHSEETNESTVRKVQLESERTWTWALCCLFDAYGCSWLDAHHELQGNQQDQEDVEFLSTGSSSLYYQCQTTTLSDILAAISLLFVLESDSKRPPGQKDVSTGKSRASLHLPAAILPAPAKVVLCDLIDHIFVALECSLNKLVADVANLEVGTPLSKRPFALVEALSCAGAWVGTVSNSATTTTRTTSLIDLSNAVRIWHAAETNFSHSAGNSVYVADASVLRRLPNLVLQADELEGTFQSFRDALQNSLPKNSPSKSLKGGKTNEPRSASKTTQVSVDDVLFDRAKWLERVKAKLHALETERKMYDSEMKQSAAALVDAGIYRGNDTPNKRRRKRKAAATHGSTNGISNTKGGSMNGNVEQGVASAAAAGEKRRRVTTTTTTMSSILPRSRNRTVDEWLQKDRDVCDEEAMEDDAFPDLEGFIAEG